MKLNKWAFGIATVSLLISGGIVALWICKANDFSVVSLDSFVGIIVALLAIIVTFVLGWQIYNAVEVKAMIKVYAKKQDEINALQSQLQEELRRFKIESDYTLHHSMHLHAISLVMQSEFKGRYDEACYHCFEALAESLQMKDPLNVEDILGMIRTNLRSIDGSIRLSQEDIDDIEEVNKIILSSTHYHWIQSKYEPLRDDFFAKIVLKK